MYPLRMSEINQMLCHIIHCVYTTVHMTLRVCVDHCEVDRMDRHQVSQATDPTVYPGAYPFMGDSSQSGSKSFPAG
jgi:hypothetical protein